MTKAAAYSYLGWAYLTRAYEETAKKDEYLGLAEEAFNKVTGYELEPNYGSMFDGTNKNCKESIFELQFTNSTVDGTYHKHVLHFWVAPGSMRGWDEIRVSEKPGTRLKLTYGEKLLENGRVDMQTKCGIYQFWEPAQTDIYICSGGDERWTPKFSYKGYRYVEVVGVDHEIGITGLAFHNDIRQTGTFSCSNPLFNQIHELVTPTILNNFHSIPTDTPTYEKRGWTGDAQSICDTVLTNLDAQSFFTKWLRDLADSQNSDGAVPDTCPGPVFYPPAPEWMCAIVMLPYQMYLHCGDKAVLHTYYPNMKRYTDYELNRLNDGMSSNLYYGDWNSPAGSCPPEGSAFNATCFVYRILTIMRQIADVLKQDADAARYQAAAEQMRQNLNTRFFNKTQMLYHTEIPVGFRQTPTVLPLAFGIAPEKLRGGIAVSLAQHHLIY